MRGEHYFDILFFDLLTSSCNDKRYFLPLVNDHNRFTRIFPLQTKDKTSNMLKNFIAMVKVQFQSQVRTMQIYVGVNL